MKKILVLLLTVFTVQAWAQYPLAKGGMQLNAGLGLSSWGLPVYVGFDYGFKQDISLGAEASFRSYSENVASKKYGHTIIGILGNGNYHFNHLLNIADEFDLYAGLNVGFYIWSSPSGYPGSGASGLGIGAQLGGRYYFNNGFGINLEFGGGNAFGGGKFGITKKF